MGDGDVVGDDFDGFGAAERVDIGARRDEVKTEVFVFAGFNEVSFVIRGGVVQLFKGPITLFNSVAKDGLNVRLIK